MFLNRGTEIGRNDSTCIRQAGKHGVIRVRIILLQQLIQQALEKFLLALQIKRGRPYYVHRVVNKNTVNRAINAIPRLKGKIDLTVGQQTGNVSTGCPVDHVKITGNHDIAVIIDIHIIDFTLDPIARVKTFVHLSCFSIQNSN